MVERGMNNLIRRWLMQLRSLSNDKDHTRSLNCGISVYNEVSEVVRLRGSRCKSDEYVGERRNLVK